MKSSWRQFGKFIIVSGFNTAVDFGVYGILTIGFDFWAERLSAAHALALIVTMAHSYLWNSYWVFPGSHQTNAATLIKFFIVSTSAMVINVWLFWLCLQFGINDWFMKVVLMGFLFLWNFVGDKWWVYTKWHGQTSNL